MRGLIVSEPVHQFVPPLALEPLFRRLGLPESWCGFAGLHDAGVLTAAEMTAAIRGGCPRVEVVDPGAERAAGAEQGGVS